MGGCCSSATPEANQTLNERRKNPDHVETVSDDEESGEGAGQTANSAELSAAEGKDSETVTLIDTEMKSDSAGTDDTPQPTSGGSSTHGRDESVSTPDPRRFVSLDSGGDTDDYMSSSDDGYSTAGDMSETDKNETQSKNQFYNLLDRHMTSKGDGSEETESTIKKVIHPPLKDATLEIKINNVQLYHDPVASAGLRAKSNGALVDDDSGPDLSRKSSRSAALKRAKSQDRKKDGMRKGVYIKADYHHSGVETGQTTDKHNSREHDCNMIDIFETMTFCLDTPPSAKGKKGGGSSSSTSTTLDVGTDDAGITQVSDSVDGRIELRVKEHKGSLYKAEKLGFASIKIQDEIHGGLIDRSGEWQTMNIPLFDMTDEEYKEARKKAHKKRKKKGKKKSSDMMSSTVKRLEVGLMRVTCRLFWTAEQISEFVKSMADAGDEAAMSYMSSIKGDKYNLAQSKPARLCVTVLGMNLDSADPSGWTAMTVRGLTAAMSMLAANDDDSDGDSSAIKTSSQMNDVFVECTYASEAIPTTHQTSLKTRKYSSKVDDVLFVGQELSFNLPPFKEERVNSSIHGQSKFHKHNPYLQFHKFPRTKRICEEVPGTVLLQVRKVIGSTLKKKKKRGKQEEKQDELMDKEVRSTDIIQDIGCCLVHIDEMFYDVTLEPGELETNEYLFKEKLYETITKQDSGMFAPLASVGSISDSMTGASVVGGAALASDESFEAKEVGYLFLKVRFDWND